MILCVHGRANWLRMYNAIRIVLNERDDSLLRLGPHDDFSVEGSTFFRSEGLLSIKYLGQSCRQKMGSVARHI